VVVVRYFGGTKLGVGGLVSAYKLAAKMALEKAVIAERTVDQKLSLRFDYQYMDKVMRIIKENDLRILSQKMELDCLICITVRKNDINRIVGLVQNLRCVRKIKKIS
jgi:putative IMPACT (imprinted ancient) family translation regulator